MKELVQRAFSMLQLSNVKLEQMKAFRNPDCRLLKRVLIQSFTLVYKSGTPGILLCFVTADPSHIRHGALHGESFYIVLLL